MKEMQKFLTTKKEGLNTQERHQGTQVTYTPSKNKVPLVRIVSGHSPVKQAFEQANMFCPANVDQESGKGEDSKSQTFSSISSVSKSKSGTASKMDSSSKKV